MNSPKKPLVVLQTYEERQPLKLNTANVQRFDSHEKPKANQTDLIKNKNGPPPAPPPLPTNSQPISPKDDNTVTKVAAKPDETDSIKNNNLPLLDRPPSTPTPDYDSLERPVNKPNFLNGSSKKIMNQESKESTKIKIPSSPSEKSSNAFESQQVVLNGTMKKSARPISITIGEYPSNVVRREPSRLDFLGESKTDDIYKNAEPIGSRLQSELVKTLSRSNLKKKTEALDLKLSQKMDNLIMDNKNFHMRYPDTGVVLTPPSISIPKISAKLVHGLAKINANNINDSGSGNIQKMLPSFHQVTMVIKDSHIPSKS